MMQRNSPSQIYQSIVLHAHLPFVRHPEHPRFFEENWLFEAITECYLPLISMLHNLDNDQIKGRITFTLTPTLTSMLRDEVLINKYSNRLSDLVELAEIEADKHNNPQSPFRDVTAFYFKHLSQLRHNFENIYSRDLIAEFIKLKASSRIEIIGCAATHALLALTDNKAVIKSQIETGIASYFDVFGSKPRGIWMPECAYTPQISGVIRESGVEYSIVDSHGILHGTPMPKYSVFAPVRDRNGLILFGRDPESSRQVWSADTGYPGDYNYREFYRDLGWDADISDIGRYLVSPEIRHDLGMKYYRITGNVPLDQKEAYHPRTALARAKEHGKHFVDSRVKQGERLISECNSSVHLLSPYDAELFGHWWFEGPCFIDSVFRNASESSLSLISPSDYLDLDREIQQVDVSISSWGNNGYFETWLNGSNDWIYQELRKTEDRLHKICREVNDSNNPLPDTEPALNQAVRELLLAQSSDWAFILTTGTTTEYATSRVHEHIENCNTIINMINCNNIDLDIINNFYKKNNIFPNIDYRVFT